MPKPHIATIGKLVRAATRLRGGGSAFPGLVVEKLDPTFIRSVLATLPYGVVVVSGTNGKTTTTKMVVELLEAHGLRVFTNKTGSNFVRGVIAAVLEEISYSGALQADIAVLELDEAHAVKFVDLVPPDYSLLLNVMRDQLDRFGEIDTTARMLTTIAKATTKTVVLNREDSRIAAIAGQLAPNTQAHYFGLSSATRALFPGDNQATDHHGQHAAATVTLDDITGQTAGFTIAGHTYSTTLALRGIYNIYNAAAAMALVHAIIPATPEAAATTLKAVSRVQPAFGRGETVMVGDTPVELVLVKNPGGFSLALQSFPPAGYDTMIAINDNYADGRDMSWLWDVDFSSLAAEGVILTTGVRAYDMALRLQYDDITPGAVTPELSEALDALLAHQPGRPKRIYCTYTAMLTLRKLLSKKTTLQEAL